MNEWTDIAGRIGALAVHADARRWEDVLALFTPEVQVDCTSLFGGERQQAEERAAQSGTD